MTRNVLVKPLLHVYALNILYFLAGFACFLRFSAFLFIHLFFFCIFRGWSCGAMVLGKLPVPGRPTIWIMIVGQGPTALAVGAGGGCSDIFTYLSFLSSFSLSLGDGPI